MHPIHLTVCKVPALLRILSALKPTCTKYNQKIFSFFPRHCVCHFHNKTENPTGWIKFSCSIQQWITCMAVCKYTELGFCVMLCKACPQLMYLHVEYVLSVVLWLWDHPRCFWRCLPTSHFPSLKRIYFAWFYLVVFQLAAAAERLMFSNGGN